MVFYAMPASFGQVTNYQVGDVVDNFTVTDTEGVEHNLYDITATGKYVFIDFFFRNCVPCQSTSRFFYELYETYGFNQEHTFMLSLSPVDNNTTIHEFENLYSGGFEPCPAAGTEGNAPPAINNFGVNAYPTYIIIGPDNRLEVSDIWPVTGMASFENAFPQGLKDLLLSTHDVVAQNSFTVAPTVSNGNFDIVLKKDVQSEISIYDMTGKRVYSNNYNSKNINLNVKLNAGVFILNVKSDGITNSQKIIIKN